MNYVKTLFVILVSVFIIGCADKFETNNALNNIPTWYQQPTILGDKYSASGSAKPNKLNDIELQKIEAASIARAELARRFQVRVKDMFKRATEQLGSGEETSITNVVQYVTKQITDVTINDSYQKKLYLDKNTKMLFILYVIDEEVANKKLKGFIADSLKSEKNLLNEIKSTKMWKELDDETAQN